MRLRKATEIEQEYITKTITDDNVNVDKVIIHTVIERSEDDIKYAVEVLHDEKATLFTTNKEGIDNKNLRQNYFSTSEIFEIIKKAAHNCEVLYKYKNNYSPLLVLTDTYAYLIHDNNLTVSIRNKNDDIDFYLSSRSMIWNNILSIETDSVNHHKLDRIYNKSIRLTHDAEEFNYTSTNSDNLDINYFQQFTEDDHFALSTISSISEESYADLCKVYSVLNGIKYTGYKIKVEENRLSGGNVSHYRKCLKEFLKFDLEKHILEGIEKEYADYIKVP